MPVTFRCKKKKKKYQTAHSFDFHIVFAVLVIVIITGLTSPSHPAKWQASFNSSEIAGNGTQEEYLMLGAIGQYASNRNTIGVDKTGHIKTKWYAHTTRTFF